jgi:uncharacterized membrane protein YhaH (DUF805 family)
MLNAKNKILLTVNAKNKFLLAVFVLASLLLIVAWAGHPIITEAEKHHDFWLVFLTFLLVLATLVPAFAVGF